MIELWFDLTNYVQYIFQDTHSISCSEGWEHWESAFVVGVQTPWKCFKLYQTLPKNF